MCILALVPSKFKQCSLLCPSLVSLCRSRQISPSVQETLRTRSDHTVSPKALPRRLVYPIEDWEFWFLYTPLCALTATPTIMPIKAPPISTAMASLIANLCFFDKLAPHFCFGFVIHAGFDFLRHKCVVQFFSLHKLLSIEMPGAAVDCDR